MSSSSIISTNTCVIMYVIHCCYLPCFKGYHVMSEIFGIENLGCPIEYLNIEIPAGDDVFDPDSTGKVVIPFRRSAWCKRSGNSPNNPRYQVRST